MILISCAFILSLSLVPSSEIHRTEKDYENALTLKMFLFQFVNFYASIFYIAFIKPWFTNPPGVESYKIGKYKTEEVRERELGGQEAVKACISSS